MAGVLSGGARTARNGAAAIVRRGRDRRFASQLRHDPAGPVLVLSPHLDDAALNTWSVMTAPAPATVVNVFAGIPRPGFVSRWDALCGARDSSAQAVARRAEDAQAMALAGCAALHLDLLEVEHRRGAPRLPLARIDEALVARVPAASAVYAPAGLAAHVDHRTVRALACAMLGTGVPVRLYAEIPYAVVHGWPTWVAGAPAEPHRDVDVFWGDALAGVPGLGPLRDARVVRLAEDAAAAKLAALRCYRSQLPALDGGDAGIVSRPEVNRFEVFWELAG